MVDLKQYIKNDIRFQIGELTLREPNKIERDELKELLMESKKVEDTDEESPKRRFNARTIYRDFTSIGNAIDELSDEDFNELTSLESVKYNKNIVELNKAVLDLIYELVREIDIQNEVMYSEIESTTNAIMRNQDATKVYEKLTKMMKKQGIDISVEDLINTGGDTQKLAEIVAESSKHKTAKKTKKVNKTK